MAVYSFDRIKQIWDGSPEGNATNNLEPARGAENAFDSMDSENQREADQTNYLRQFQLREIIGPEIRNNLVSFRVFPIDGEAYSVSKEDAAVQQAYMSPETQSEGQGVVTEDGEITESTPEDPIEANQREIEIDQQQDIDEDLTELTVNFERTEDTLHIEVIDGIGVIDASYTVSKENYEDEGGQALFDLDTTFTTKHPSITDIFRSRINIANGSKYGWEEYPLRPPVGDLSTLPGMEVPADLPENLSQNMPDLPENDADVERFKREMLERGLLFGEGTVIGLPEFVPPSSTQEEDAYNEAFDDAPDVPVVESSEGRVKTQASIAADQAPGAPTKIKPGSKPVIMIEGIAKDVEPHVGVGPNTGLLDRPLPEPVPFFAKCSSDKVMSGKNNTWIVFGRDRPGGLSSGYGPGQGHTQAGAIDIVVGRMSPKPISFDKRGNKVEVGPVFESVKYDYGDAEVLDVMDAGRIYISQKTDIDSNFGLNQPKGDVLSFPTSGIGIKADAVRIISRNGGVRIVTEAAGLPNSQGGNSAKEASGIFLIAANKANELQPMVLGNNLTLCLKDVIQLIADTVGMVASIKSDLISLNSALLAHEHVNPVTGPTVKLPQLTAVTMKGLVKLISVDTFSNYGGTTRVKTIEDTYLTDTNTSIKSKYNKVN